MPLNRNPDDATDLGDTKVIQRRLLLAKQLFVHGLDHSNRAGSLNKMIAVHNFHNAIEVTLRSVMLRYQIRSEKTLNIDFERMLNEIDNHKPFKEQGKRLPNRQELRRLNDERNLVQHQAHEPATGTMEELRVHTRSALTRIFDEYFGLFA